MTCDNLRNPMVVPAGPANLSPEGVKELEKAFINYEKERALIAERSAQEVRRYAQKRNIDEESLARYMKIQEDTRIKAGMLKEKFVILADGNIVRTVELFMEQSKSYEAVNFKLVMKPLKLLECGRSDGAVLFLNVISEDLKTKSLFLDLEKEEAGYYFRKFRGEGLELKRKRKESREAILEIVQAFANIAEVEEVPSRRGFYVTAEKILKYAGPEDWVWQEVKEYAR